MNNIVRLFNESKNSEEFAKGYLSYLSELLAKLNTKTISAFIEELIEARRQDKTIFIAGNGGSAATSSHMANDIALDVFKKSKNPKPFRIHSLTDNVPIMTAIGNDDGYDQLFVYQLKIHYRPGDRLIVISASGNSPNIVGAAKWVKSQGGKVFGLLGFDGGELKAICDLSIVAETPKKEYGPVEDIHMIMDHLMANYLLGFIIRETGQ